MSKITYVLPDLSTIGAQRIAIDYGAELIRRGYSVHWLCANTENRSHEVDPVLVLGFGYRIFGSIRAVRTIESIFNLFLVIMAINPDIIISVTPFYNRILCVFKLFGLIKSRLIIEDHAYPPESNRDEFRSKSVRLIYERTTFLYRYANSVRVLSPEAKLYYDRFTLSGQVKFQPNLLNLERIRSMARGFSHLVPTKTRQRIVYIGRFTTQKNIKFLILSFAQLLKNMDADLYIIGYGPLEENLKKLAISLGILGNVFFKSSSELNYSYLASADLFAITSLWEGMPLVIIEAMELNVPVVTTKFLTGPSFLLGENCDRGLIVDTADHVEFSKAMLEVLIDSEASKRRAISAKEFVDRKLDISNSFECYIREFIKGT